MQVNLYASGDILVSAPEYWAIGLSLVFYVASFIVSCISGRKGPIVLMLLSALLFQLASASIRWYDIGHPPIFGTYEAALAASWFLALFVAFSVWMHFAGAPSFLAW